MRYLQLGSGQVFTVRDGQVFTVWAMVRHSQLGQLSGIYT